MKISLKLVYQYMAIFFNFSPTPNHLHPLLVVDEMTMINSGTKGLTLEALNYFIKTLKTKCLSKPFPIHLNTYVMGLRPF